MATGEPTVVCSVGDSSNCGIQKRVLHAGKGDLPSFEDGTKVCRKSVLNSVYLCCIAP